MALRRVGSPANVAIDHYHNLNWFELVESLKHLRHRQMPDMPDEMFAERMGLYDPDTKGKTGLLELTFEDGKIRSALRKLRRFEQCKLVDMRFAQAYAYALGRQLTFRIAVQELANTNARCSPPALQPI